MEKLRIICALLALLTTGNFYAQIVIGGEEEEIESPKPSIIEGTKKNLPPKSGDNSLFIFLNRSGSFRVLTPSTTAFGDSLGERANEKKLKTLNFGAGFKSRLSNNLFFGAGVSVLQNGESYNYTAQDTSYSYESKYFYTGMPLFLEYSYGKDISVTGTAGIIPAMFVSYLREIVSEDSTGLETKEKVRAKNGSSDFNPVIVSGFVAIGVNVKYSRSWSLFVRPEYRFQLNNTFGQNSPYVHKATAFGVTFGFNYLLD